MIHDGRVIMKFDTRGYSSLMSDFLVQTSLPQRLKNELKKKRSYTSKAC
jgi:hypothetical protein